MQSKRSGFFSRRWLEVMAFCIFFAIRGIPAGYCADIERESFSLLYEPEQAVTAMRAPEPVVESPAIISVFTQQQIRALGARTIPELLEFAPGFSPWRSVAGDWWPGPRGILDSNRSFLVLIDGISINNQFLGTPYWTYDLLDLSRFSRIEIIRGPGSALYGSNAFLAVINCITELKPTEGGSVRTIFGTNNTKGIGFSRVFKSGKTLFDLNASGMGSDGQSRYIEKDVYGKSGHTQDGFTKKDLMLKVSDPRGYTFLAHHVEGAREGYIGYFDNLNDKTFYRRSNDMLSLRYRRELASESDFSVGMFFNRFNDSEAGETVSPFITFVNDVTYTSGVMEEDHSKDAVWGLNFLWKGPKTGKHQFSCGGEMSFIDLVEATVLASYDSPNDANLLTLIPGASPKSERFTDNSLTVQDDIRLTSKMRLVLGTRYDKHSLFGDTMSPRAGLIYRLTDRWTGKLLYGKAYRNPDFLEITNNRNLKPELINTSEFQLLGELFKGWLTKINFFVNNLSDRIESSRSFTDYRNVSQTMIDGMEFEVKKRFHAGQEFFGNVSTFRLRSESSAPVLAPGLPHNKVNVGYTFKAWSYETCIWGSISSSQPRNVWDTRDPLPGVGLLHLTIQKTGFPGVADRIILRVRNLLNTYQTFVSPPISDGVLNEFPQPGREISVEMSWNL
ncbi:MAG: TonB-dependent receptor [Candidatus Ozemobacteraceae bacterium]